MKTKTLSLKQAIKRWFTPPEALTAGSYHFQAPPDAPAPYRLHLRLEPDRSGVFIINAATVLHLNPTAAEYAYHLVQNTPEEEVASAISRRYRINPTQAHQDFVKFKEQIQTLISTPDLDPVTFLDFDRLNPYSQEISAPYRLDCALTYRLPEGADAAYAPTKQVDRELDTREWETILDKAWEAGIPHVVFTGGEPTLREDLSELIRYAEQKGMVSGLLTDGQRLADPEYLDMLLQTGLDHIMLNLDVDNLAVAAAVKNTLAADVHLVVHLTITAQNAARASWQLEKLQQSGITALSLSAAEASLQPALQAMREHSAALGMSLVWDLPVPYSAFNPVSLETAAEEQPSGAGHAWLYVEPDGDVLPAQGINRVLGNLLRDPWNAIWQNSERRGQRQ